MSVVSARGLRALDLVCRRMNRQPPDRSGLDLFVCTEVNNNNGGTAKARLKLYYVATSRPNVSRSVDADNLQIGQYYVSNCTLLLPLSIFIHSTNHLNICLSTAHVVVTKRTSMVRLCPRMNTVEVIGVTTFDFGHFVPVLVVAQTY